MTNLNEEWRTLQQQRDGTDQKVTAQMAEVERLRQQLLAAIRKLETLLGIHRA